MFTLLFAEDPAPAAPAGQQPSPLGNPMFLMLGVLFLFWIVVIMPMSRRQKKEQAAMLAGIGRGTKILTSSGIVGVVVTAKDGEDEVTIRSEDTKLRIKRSAVVQVLGTDAADAK